MTQIRSGRRGLARVVVIAATVVIAAHGLIHLMGMVVSVPAIGLAPEQAVAGLAVDGLILALLAVSWLRTKTMPS